ncbi:hypothetical protein [Enterobacter sp. BIDMC 30]|uniref:hypothetical protein n=1 Tax=Enterobacter sp. BIDMC 30 TaxID=1329842 RepID=UPI00044812B7|nr:hypothetical protein [Enterobacter sp. BIDMC 30]EUM09816.1 hypothetical protein L466_01924 [Enterobacter sp. BIDMC 30]
MSNIDKQAKSVIRELIDDARARRLGKLIITADEMEALLDELEAKDAQIVNLTVERDALREGVMGHAKHSNTRAAADIYFQLVEECEIPLGGSLVEYVSDLRERAAMLQGAEPVSNRDELPLDYLQGHKDGLEWAAQLAEANHPHTGDWLYDDPLELAKAIRKGPEMPEGGNSPVIPDGWVLVPKEPTPAMLNAAWVSHGIYHASAYRTMLAAAPQQEVKNG